MKKLKQDTNPLDYEHKHQSMADFARHINLKAVRLRTVQAYYRQMRLVRDHFGRDPKHLSRRRMEEYLLHLKLKKQWSRSSLRQAIAACRMYYCEMLGKKWRLWDLVEVRDRKSLPVVLSPEEVAAVIDEISLLRHRVPLRLAYCCGLRLDEAVHLTVDDVEPQRICVRDGKGGKDRHVPLSSKMYRQLRYYWSHHRNPKWIFPSAGRGHPNNAKGRMGESAAPFGKGALQLAFHEALGRTNIRKKATVHTLRHSYATHLLAMGVNIRQLQIYLGRGDIQTTTIYTHLIPFGEDKSLAHVEAIAEATF